MERRISVVGLGGSMAPTSSTVAALKLALAGAEEAGAETRLFEISVLDLPMFVPGAEAPDLARRLTEAVYEADGLLWSSPVYHGTISGSFKNALDWLELLLKEQSIVFSACYATTDGRHDFELAIELMASGRVELKQMVTHQFPLADIQKGFETAYQKSTGSIKVQIHS